ncbi:hypothetical protein ABE530_04490 [Brucella sp. TWI559]
MIQFFWAIAATGSGPAIVIVLLSRGRVWRTLTFLGAVHRDRRIAPCAFDGPINRQCFCALAQARGIVDMGNLGSDKSAVIRNAVRVTGARLCFLHPIYPTLNQIDRAECINYLEHTGYVSVKKLKLARDLLVSEQPLLLVRVAKQKRKC